MSDKLMKLRELLDTIPLPKGIKWYTVSNRKIYELRGQDGSVKPAYIAYLVNISRGKHFRYAIEFKENWSLSTCRQKVEKAIPIFQKKIKEQLAKPFDPNAGDLGLEATN